MVTISIKLKYIRDCIVVLYLMLYHHVQFLQTSIKSIKKISFLINYFVYLGTFCAFTITNPNVMIFDDIFLLL